ncbi:hypothetical protein D3C81_1617090 [compost metagenome]
MRGQQRRRGQHQQRVTIGRGLGHGFSADGARGAGAVVDHHGLLQVLAHFLADDAGSGVGRAAGRERHDEPDRLVRVALLGQRGRGGQRQRGRDGQRERGNRKTTTLVMHGVSSNGPVMAGLLLRLTN